MTFLRALFSAAAISARNYRVLVTAGGVPKQSIEYLKSKVCVVDQWPSENMMPREEMMKGIKEADALFCTLSDKIGRDVIQAGKNLKVVATMSVGTDHVDKAALKERGIRFGFTPDVLTNAVAELTIGLTLTTLRRTFEAGLTVRNGEWPNTWRPLWMCGNSLHGSVIGVIGLGRIGQATARRLKAFEPAKMLYAGPTRKEKMEAELGMVRRDLDGLLKESDVVILTCALTEQTKNLMTKKRLSLMKKGSYLINTSRGTVIDQDALVDLLREGHFGGVGLDVTVPEPLPTNHPLLKFPECTIFPHIGSSDIKTREKMGIMTVENILTALDGKEMPAEWKL